MRGAAFFREVWNAGLGWRDLLYRREGWLTHFVLSLPGLRRALSFYLLVVGLNLIVQLFGAELAVLTAIFANIAVNLLPELGFAFAVLVTTAALRLRGALLGLLVPGTYALAFLLLIGLPLSLLQVPVGPPLLIAFGCLLVVLGRAAAGLSLRLAIAFAALCVLLLVAMPLSLYMLMAPGPGPI